MTHYGRSGQIKTNAVTWSSIVGSAAFQAGVHDFQKGLSPAYDKWAKTNKSWKYERGRLFAAWLAGKGVKVPPSRVGRRVSGVACAVLKQAFIEKAIT